MKHGRVSHSLAWRHGFLIVILLAVFCGLGWRMVHLMLVKREFLLKQGDARAIRVIETSAFRGAIYDRNGEPLAVTTQVDSVSANPKQFNIDDPQVAELARLLDLPVEWFRARISQNQNKEFVYLKRQVNPWLAKQIMQLRIAGVFLQHEYKRYYPSGEAMVHVLGFTNIDDHGQEGLELAYDGWLRGVPGKKRVIQDRLGHVVEDLDLISEAKPGHDLVLSIDKRIQYSAYRELKDAVEKYQAQSGSVIVLDVLTSEVLAMVNQPSFNPNNRPGGNSGKYRNRAVTDAFEPGSTMKPFTVALALDTGQYQPDTIVDTAPGWMNLDGNRVRDLHPLGSVDVRTILQKSSNVGVAKLALSLPPDSLWQLFYQLGFGQRTSSGFPGEGAGKLRKHEKWSPFTLATLSFGYGMSATALQLVQAYAILATDGIKHPISFLRLDKPLASERILKAKVAEQVLAMLEAVIERGGTGTQAKVPGYRVTGKTGTVRIVGSQGYLRGHHIGMFVGAVPVSHPRLVMVVVINDPQAGGLYYGGSIAAPVFSKVMANALNILGIPPDHDTTSTDAAASTVNK